MTSHLSLSGIPQSFNQDRRPLDSSISPPLPIEPSNTDILQTRPVASLWNPSVPDLPKMAPNPFLLAADNSPELLPLLRETPALASSQDEHGYSLVHAAASYNHLDLLRTLINEFKVDVNLKDEDDETALFVVETPEAAKELVELGVDVHHVGNEGFTAWHKIEVEGEFPEVAAYLASLQPAAHGEAPKPRAPVSPLTNDLPAAPEGLPITIGSMDESEVIPGEVDPEFRRRIEALAQRDDLNTPQGQDELRKLVEDALTDQGLGEGRSVRTKQ